MHRRAKRAAQTLRRQLNYAEQGPADLDVYETLLDCLPLSWRWRLVVALGERERGLEWADRALAIDPDEAMLLYNIACIKSMANAREQALDCLERSVRAGLVLRDWLIHDNDFDPIRDDPRFQAVVKSLE